MTIDDRIAGIASTQHGLITRAQALTVGLRPHHIQSRVVSGRWDLTHRGVFRITGAPPSPDQRLMAALLAVRGTAVVSHRAAAERWHLEGVERGWVEISVTASSRPRLDGVTIHRTKDLQPHHVATRHGLPVTNPMRTIVDLGLVVPRYVVERALDDALGRKLVTLAGMTRIWKDVARPGRNGSGVLRSLLEEHLPHPHGTVLEKKMLRLHRDHGLPEPEVEYDVRSDSGRFIGRVDFCHPEHRLVIECDGYEKRTSLESFQSDRQRDRALKAAGWTVIRFTWLEVCFTPADVAAEIASFLGLDLSASAARSYG